jgi:hypothetical protein
MQAKLTLLQEELAGLELAAQHLDYSITRCANLSDWMALGGPTLEQLERLESLTSRFARLSDLLIQRMFRLIDEIELNGDSTILDRIYRAEKRGWANAANLIQIRELRNLIAHEYESESMHEIYTTVLALAPILLASVPKITDAAHLLLKQHLPRIKPEA